VAGVRKKGNDNSRDYAEMRGVAFVKRHLEVKSIFYICAATTLRAD